MNKAKASAGYHMLMILSAVDNEFREEEATVIEDYIQTEYASLPDIEAEKKALHAISTDSWDAYFSKCRDTFYTHSTLAERNSFLQFAMDLVKADKVISPEENYYLAKLFNIWDPENE